MQLLCLRMYHNQDIYELKPLKSFGTRANIIELSYLFWAASVV
jgi:hypothetical protein